MVPVIDEDAVIRGSISVAMNLSVFVVLHMRGQPFMMQDFYLMASSHHIRKYACNGAGHFALNLSVKICATIWRWMTG